MPTGNHNVFGSNHTEIKLAALKRYMSSYCGALKNQPFDLVYFDAFAGSGKRLEAGKQSQTQTLLDIL